MSSFIGLIGFFVIQETYAPGLLQGKARKLRYETENWAVHSNFDETQISWNIILQAYLVWPFTSISQEPILVFFISYISVVYGIIYMFLETYPISFKIIRDWDRGVGALPFIGLLVGLVAGD